MKLTFIDKFIYKMKWWLVNLLFLAVVMNNMVLSMSTHIKVSIFDSVGPIQFSRYCCDKKCDDPDKQCVKRELSVDNRACKFTCRL